MARPRYAGSSLPHTLGNQVPLLTFPLQVLSNGTSPVQRSPPMSTHVRYLIPCLTRAFPAILRPTARFSRSHFQVADCVRE